MLNQCSLNAQSMLFGCSFNALRMLFKCSLNAQSMLIGCSFNALWMLNSHRMLTDALRMLSSCSDAHKMLFKIEFFGNPSQGPFTDAQRMLFASGVNSPKLPYFALCCSKSTCIALRLKVEFRWWWVGGWVVVVGGANQ